MRASDGLGGRARESWAMATPVRRRPGGPKGAREPRTRQAGPSERDQPAADPETHGLGAARRAELRRDRRDVELRGVLADSEPLADAPIREALGEELEHLALAGG